MSRIHHRQLIASVVLTIAGGETTAEGALAPVVIGQALACRIEHTGSGFDLTIKDSTGYDVLDGKGAGVGASGKSINANDIRGNPCYKTLTARLTGGAATETATVHLYILGKRGPRDNPA